MGGFFFQQKCFLMQCMKSDVHWFFSTSLQCVINFVSLCLFSFCMLSQELIPYWPSLSLKKERKRWHQSKEWAETASCMHRLIKRRLSETFLIKSGTMKEECSSYNWSIVYCRILEMKLGLAWSCKHKRK